MNAMAQQLRVAGRGTVDRRDCSAAAVQVRVFRAPDAGIAVLAAYELQYFEILVLFRVDDLKPCVKSFSVSVGLS